MNVTKRMMKDSVSGTKYKSLSSAETRYKISKPKSLMQCFVMNTFNILLQVKTHLFRLSFPIQSFSLIYTNSPGLLIDLEHP